LRQAKQTENDRITAQATQDTLTLVLMDSWEGCVNSAFVLNTKLHAFFKVMAFVR
jgi:hypothetical protein